MHVIQKGDKGPPPPLSTSAKQILFILGFYPLVATATPQLILPLSI